MLNPIASANWNYDAAAHLALRASFGEPPAEVEKWINQGLDSTLEHLLRTPPPSVAPPDWAYPTRDEDLLSRIRNAETTAEDRAQRTSTNVNERQRTSTNVSERQRTSANVSERQRTSANVSERQRTSANVNERQRTSANVNERQRTSAMVFTVLCCCSPSFVVVHCRSLPTRFLPMAERLR